MYWLVVVVVVVVAVVVACRSRVVLVQQKVEAVARAEAYNNNSSPLEVAVKAT